MSKFCTRLSHLESLQRRPKAQSMLFWVPVDYGYMSEYHIVVLKFYIVVSVLLGLPIFNFLLWKFSNVYKSKANSIMNLYVSIL